MYLVELFEFEYSVFTSIEEEDMKNKLDTQSWVESSNALYIKLFE
jgi:hypothetical protein